MAATLAAAGFNLNESSESNDRDAGLSTVSNTRSPDNITAATLLAAAAAHAAASSAARRTSIQVDEKDEDDDEKHEDKDRNMEVNVDEDEEGTDCERTSEKEVGDSMVVDKRNSTPHDLSKTNEYEDNRTDSIDSNNRLLLSAESSPSSQISSFDKHRRKTRKQDVMRDKFQ